MAVMDWVAVMLDEDRRRRMAGEDGTVANHETILLRPTDRLHHYQAYQLSSDSTDFGRKVKTENHQIAHQCSKT
jgi:hypothetical protein